MATYLDIQDCITLTVRTWLINSSGLSGSRVVDWNDLATRNAPQPESPYFSVQIVDYFDINAFNESQAETTGLISTLQYKRAEVDINCWGIGANRLLRQAHQDLDTYLFWQEFLRANISLIKTGVVRELSFIEADDVHERAHVRISLDIRNKITQDPDWFNKVYYEAAEPPIESTIVDGSVIP